MNKQKVIKLQCPIQRIKKSSKSPEQALMRAIIYQFSADATNYSSCPKAIRLEKAAKEWLFNDNPGFAEICELADYSMVTARLEALEMIERHHRKQAKKAQLPELPNIWFYTPLMRRR